MFKLINNYIKKRAGLLCMGFRLLASSMYNKLHNLLSEDFQKLQPTNVHVQ